MLFCDSIAYSLEQQLAEQVIFQIFIFRSDDSTFFRQMHDFFHRVRNGDRFAGNFFHYFRKLYRVGSFQENSFLTGMCSQVPL